MKYEESIVVKIVNELEGKLPTGWTKKVTTEEEFNAPRNFGVPTTCGKISTSYIDSINKTHEFFITLEEDNYRKPEYIHVTVNGGYKRRSNIKKYERVLEIAKESYRNFTSGIEANIRLAREKEDRKLILEADFPNAIKSTYAESWTLINGDKNSGSGIAFKKNYIDGYLIEKVYGNLSKEQVRQIYNILITAGKVSI